MADADPRFHAWSAAVRAMYRAIETGTRSSWKTAGRAWDALVALHAPTDNDREIYRRLAVQSWLQAADTRRS